VTIAQDVSLFSQAADLIEHYGWTTKVYRSSDGCFCAAGALLQVLFPNISYEQYEVRLRARDIPESESINIRKFARYLLNKSYRSLDQGPVRNIQVALDAISTWNDYYDMTRETVISTLREYVP
jgi:hypothetical protein